MRYIFHLSSKSRKEKKLELNESENKITVDILKSLGFEVPKIFKNLVFKIIKYDNKGKLIWKIRNESNYNIYMDSLSENNNLNEIPPGKEYTISNLLDEKIYLDQDEKNYLIFIRTKVNDISKNDDEPMDLNLEEIEEYMNLNNSSNILPNTSVRNDNKVNKNLEDLLEEYVVDKNTKKKNVIQDTIENNHFLKPLLNKNAKRIIDDDDEENIKKQDKRSQGFITGSPLKLSHLQRNNKSELKINSDDESLSDSLMNEVLDRINMDKFYLASHDENEVKEEEDLNEDFVLKKEPKQLGDNYTFTFQGKENISTNLKKLQMTPQRNNIDTLLKSHKLNKSDILKEIKQRREHFKSATKKFGGEFNENGKRINPYQESEFISAFKSKRLKKATDNRELQIELNASCAICLDIIQTLANLDNCNHDFCKQCILQWSKNTNLCPLCKKEFKKIVYYEKNKRKEIKVKKKKLAVDETFYEESIINSSDNCMICGGGEDHSRMLVCDGCQYNVCHTYCDGLDAIPDNEWFCRECRNNSYARNVLRNFHNQELSEESMNDDDYSPRVLLEDDEEEDLVSENFDDVVYVNTRSRRSRDSMSISSGNRSVRNSNNRRIRVNISLNVNLPNRRNRRGRSNR